MRGIEGRRTQPWWRYERLHGRVPDDALVIRPVGRGPLAAIPTSRRARALQIVIGLVPLALVLVFGHPFQSDVLAWLLVLPAIGLFVALTVRQPGTYFYVAGDRVGLRTTFGSRYEVGAAQVRTVHMAMLPYYGVLASTLALEGEDGRALLHHSQAVYAEDDLRRLADRIGAVLVTA